MTRFEDLTPEERTLVQFEGCKRNLVEQMVLYGIDQQQAQIQVEGLVTWTIRAQEAIRAVQGREARGEVGRRQEEEGG